MIETEFAGMIRLVAHTWMSLELLSVFGKLEQLLQVPSPLRGPPLQSAPAIPPKIVGVIPRAGVVALLAVLGVGYTDPEAPVTEVIQIVAKDGAEIIIEAKQRSARNMLYESMVFCQMSKILS